MQLDYHTLFYCNYPLTHNLHYNIVFYTKTPSQKLAKLTNNKHELIF